MLRESFSFAGACIIDSFDINWFTNLKQALTYLHLLKHAVWSHLLKKSLIENFIFCAIQAGSFIKLSFNQSIM